MKVVFAAMLTWVLLTPLGALAQADRAASRFLQTLPTELQVQMPAGHLAGRARFNVWGFHVYDAALWVAPGFKAQNFEDHAFALELTYGRRFTSQDIAKRSVVEMARQRPIPMDQLGLWERQLQAALPDVQAGDRLTGIYKPGHGAQLLVNGKPHKTLSDLQLSKMFFGIWLAEATSEPALRRDLIAQVSP